MICICYRYKKIYKDIFNKGTVFLCESEVECLDGLVEELVDELALDLVLRCRRHLHSNVEGTLADRQAMWQLYCRPNHDS